LLGEEKKRRVEERKVVNSFYFCFYLGFTQMTEAAREIETSVESEKVEERSLTVRVEGKLSSVSANQEVPEWLERALKTLHPATGPDVKVKQRWTVPQLKHKRGEVVFVQFESEMVKADDRVDESSGEIMKGPWISYVIDLRTGERCTYLVNAVARGILQKIPGGYIGKCFAMRKGNPVADRPMGKRYCEMEVIEIVFPPVAMLAE